MKTLKKGDWFTIDQIDDDTFIISEYRHWEETHCYLLNGAQGSFLIDTGLGICNIYDEVRKLTDKPVAAVATHIHWDHIGGHKYFPDFYAHAAELDWLNGKFPLSAETVRGMVVERCDLPDGFDVSEYEMFQGQPTRLLDDGDVIDLGGRSVKVLHTPGHSPGHLCFWEEGRGYLFTGDLVYKDRLFAYYPSTDPKDYLASLEKIARLVGETPYQERTVSEEEMLSAVHITPEAKILSAAQTTPEEKMLSKAKVTPTAQKIFPAHHSLDIQPEIILRMRDAFRQLKADGKLHHGSGVFEYGDWSVWL